MSKKKKPGPVPDDIAALSFEEAYAELKTVTERLEAEEVDLETTLADYGRAVVLTRHCSNLLEKAEEQIRVLTENEGVIRLEALDSDDRE